MPMPPRNYNTLEFLGKAIVSFLKEKKSSTMSSILDHFKDEGESLVEKCMGKLLEEGVIYEPRPGVYSLL